MKLIHFVNDCYVNAEDILMINYHESEGHYQRVYIYLKSNNVNNVYADVKSKEDAKNRIKYVTNQIMS